MGEKLNLMDLGVTAILVLFLMYLYNLLVGFVMPTYAPFAFNFANLPLLLSTIIGIMFALYVRAYVKKEFKI